MRLLYKFLMLITARSSLLHDSFYTIPIGLSPVIGKNCLFDAALASGAVPAPFGTEPFTTLVRLLGKDRVVGASKIESGMFDALVTRGVRSCWFGQYIEIGNMIEYGNGQETTSNMYPLRRLTVCTRGDRSDRDRISTLLTWVACSPTAFCLC